MALAMNFTQQQKIQIGLTIMEWMGDVFYEPWEYDAEPPEGFDSWTAEAVQHWNENRALDAAEGAIQAIEKIVGRGLRGWRPPRSRE